MSISAELREYAETPDRFSRVVPGASVERFADERVCILQGPRVASVSGVHVRSDEVESLVAEVRECVQADARPIWWIGPSAEPPDILERLRALGMSVPRDGGEVLHAVVLTDVPPRVDHVDACRVDTFEQYREARMLQADAFNVSEAHRETIRARIREDFDESQRLGVPLAFLATIDGRPAGAARAMPSDRGVFMIGGATAEWARGRGAYRALVRARWDYAAARGTPALAAHADPETSYPILRRLGFEDVCVIRRLEDRAELQ